MWSTYIVDLPKIQKNIKVLMKGWFFLVEPLGLFVLNTLTNVTFVKTQKRGIRVVFKKTCVLELNHNFRPYQDKFHWILWHLCVQIASESFHIRTANESTVAVETDVMQIKSGNLPMRQFFLNSIGRVCYQRSYSMSWTSPIIMSKYYWWKYTSI